MGYKGQLVVDCYRKVIDCESRDDDLSLMLNCDSIPHFSALLSIVFFPSISLSLFCSLLAQER